LWLAVALPLGRLNVQPAPVRQEHIGMLSITYLPNSILGHLFLLLFSVDILSFIIGKPSIGRISRGDG